MPQLIQMDDLPHSETAHRFEGHRFGEIGVSFFVTHGGPGTGPGLHRHPYPEVFVVQEGNVTFTVGEETVEAVAGQIVIVPAGEPHKFVNAGPGLARHLDIHVSGRMAQEELAP